MSGMGPPSGPPPPPHAFFNQGAYQAQAMPQVSMPQHMPQVSMPQHMPQVSMPQQSQPQFAPMHQVNIAQQSWNPPGFVGGIHPAQQHQQVQGFNPFAAPPPPPPSSVPSTSNMGAPGPSHAYGANWQQPPPSTSSFQPTPSTPAPTAGPSRESSIARYFFLFMVDLRLTRPKTH